MQQEMNQHHLANKTQETGEDPNGWKTATIVLAVILGLLLLFLFTKKLIDLRKRRSQSTISKNTTVEPTEK
jgi:flagellar biosynthesis/type III secretory pathway M-ring protein FliF/YscJ